MSKELKSHPSTSVMVHKALEVLHNRRGVSFHAIKQYVFSMYADVDPVRSVPFIKKYLVNAISEGQIVRTKGVGMAGSFRLVPVNKTSSKKEKKPSEATVDQKETKSVTKKTKKAEQLSENTGNKKSQKPTVKAQKPVPDQKGKKKRISITATKVRKGASKVAKK